LVEWIDNANISGKSPSKYIKTYLKKFSKNEIKDMYAEKGYFQALITNVLEYSNDSSSAILTYKINEKSKVKIVRLSFDALN